MSKEKYYVTMTDRFMSGWGKAEGLINKFVVECDTYKQAEIIKYNASRRKEMKYINITISKPYYNPSRYLVSHRLFEDLGQCWTAKHW